MPQMFLLTVEFDGEMEYGIYSTPELAKKEAIKVIETAPYFDVDNPTFTEERHGNGLLKLVWEETPMRVEIIPIGVDNTLVES